MFFPVKKVAFNFSGDKAEESTQKYDWMKNGVFKSKATISTGGNHKKCMAT